MTIVTTAIIASFSTLVVALLSGFIGWRMHMRLRAEKFKEIVYKEQVAIYKELSHRLWNFFKHCKDAIKDRTKEKELINEMADFLHFIFRNNLFISKTVFKKFLEFHLACAEMLLSEKSLHVDADMEQQLILINKKYSAAADAMRQELAIEKVIEDILKTIDPDSYRWKGKNKTDAETDSSNQKPDKKQGG